MSGPASPSSPDWRTHESTEQRGQLSGASHGAQDPIGITIALIRRADAKQRARGANKMTPPPSPAAAVAGSRWLKTTSGASSRAQGSRRV
ncbi:hypothetical protein CDD83_10918 [Cordyceps sp. RAO-2017]|nr:hypothetical protein CDD83_10918 [Cordyceps sp. RAO-2017]